MKTTRRERWNATRKLRKMGFKRLFAMRWRLRYAPSSPAIRADAQGFKYSVLGQGFNCPVAAATYLLMQDAEPSGKNAYLTNTNAAPGATRLIVNPRAMGKTTSINWAWLDEFGALPKMPGKQP